MAPDQVKALVVVARLSTSQIGIGQGCLLFFHDVRAHDFLLMAVIDQFLVRSVYLGHFRFVLVQNVFIRHSNYSLFFKFLCLQDFLDHRARNEVALLVSAVTNGATPMLMACRNGHLDVVEYLVERCGADIEQAGSGELFRLNKKSVPIGLFSREITRK